MADLSQDQVNAIHDALKVAPSLRHDPFALQSIKQTYGVDAKQLSGILTQKRVENQVHRSLFGGITHWLSGVGRDISHIMSGTAPIVGMPSADQSDPNYDLAKGELYKMGQGAYRSVTDLAQLTNPAVQQQLLANTLTHPWDLFMLPVHAWAGMSSDFHRQGASYTLGTILPFLLAGGGAGSLTDTALGRIGA